MSQTSVTFEESFAVPPDVLFDTLLDHEGMNRWLDAKISVVRPPEDGGDGVGAIRRIHTPIGGVDEEVTYVLRPRRIVYRIVRGAPGVRFHRGEILIEPWGETGSQLTWNILLDSAIPGVAALIGAGVRAAFRKGFGKLRAQLAEEDYSSSSSDGASAIGSQPKR